MGDVLTVEVQAPRGAKPAREMRLPARPGDTLLAGKEISFRVHIDREGRATAKLLNAPPEVTPFTLERAFGQIEEVLWIAALDENGRPVEDDARVVFRWR